jgi:CRISPR/Cas system Type II protein with McrA/HNH and RuvC-like nuclease domain
MDHQHRGSRAGFRIVINVESFERHTGVLIDHRFFHQTRLRARGGQHQEKQWFLHSVSKAAISRPSTGALPHPQGHVASGTLVRCDVFSKKGKFHLVPIYKHQLMERTPPMRAIVAGKLDEKDWTPIDSTFRFEFSLWTNSRFELTYVTGKKVEGCHSR